MTWHARQSRTARLVARLSTGVALGAAPGVLYGGLVAAVHLGVYGRWDQVPTFAVACVLVGAVVGLLGGAVSALWGDAAPEPRDRSTAG
jgi:hypothetical protein